MKKYMMTMLLTLMTLAVSAQSSEKLYKDGKALYDAKKYEQAVPKLKTAAEKGHKKAQYRLGRCYEKGYGVTKSDETAVFWYQKAANQGYHKAQYQLGKASVLPQLLQDTDAPKHWELGNV